MKQSRESLDSCNSAKYLPLTPVVCKICGERIFQIKVHILPILYTTTYNSMSRLADVFALLLGEVHDLPAVGVDCDSPGHGRWCPVLRPTRDM